jgi:hypothetical protein
LHATAIEQALNDGMSIYNFGANPGLPGVSRFKRSFGAEAFRYRVYRNEKWAYRTFRHLTGRR